MKRFSPVFFAIFAALQACGDGPQESLRDQIKGGWARYDAATGCAEALVVGLERVSTVYLCATSETTAEAEVYEGPYELDGDLLTWTVDSSSCAQAAQEPPPVRVSVAHGQLRTESTSGAVIYDRAPDGELPGGMAATFGCWGSDGEFSARPVSAL